MTAKAYEVHLEMFEGPLDLLLYLIRKNDLEIQNIPISQITQEYLAYLDLMKELNLDVAGDFLVMAATLVQIKARSLLPAQAGLEDEGPDPESELRAKLVEYQKFQQAGSYLHQRAAACSDVFYRGLPRFEEREKSLDIRIFDLLTALKEILDRKGLDASVLAGEEYPIEEKIAKILGMLEARPYVLLREIFDDETRRRAIITCFLALLELVKVQRVFARQEAPLAEIRIYKKEVPAEPMPAVWPGASEEGPAAAGPG
jgi:segregation and condensation protein A